MEKVCPYTGDTLKSLIEAYNCRICKVKLTEENYGGIGYNHGIFCKTCMASEEVKSWNEHYRKMYDALEKESERVNPLSGEAHG